MQWALTIKKKCFSYFKLWKVFKWLKQWVWRISCFTFIMTCFFEIHSLGSKRNKKSLGSRTFSAPLPHCPVQNSFQIILLFKSSDDPKKKNVKVISPYCHYLLVFGKTLNIVFVYPNGRFWPMKSMSTVQKDWVQMRPMSVFKSGT